MDLALSSLVAKIVNKILLNRICQKVNPYSRGNKVFQKKLLNPSWKFTKLSLQVEIQNTSPYSQGSYKEIPWPIPICDSARLSNVDGYPRARKRTSFNTLSYTKITDYRLHSVLLIPLFFFQGSKRNARRSVWEWMQRKLNQLTHLKKILLLLLVS